MDKLPQVSGKKMGRVLLRLGFRMKSQKGSHMKFTREYGSRREVIIVPNHKILRKGTLNNILKRVEVHTGDALRGLMK